MNENPTQPVPDDILLQLLECLIAAIERQDDGPTMDVRSSGNDFHRYGT